MRRLAPQVARFGLVGVLGIAAYLAAFSVLRDALGPQQASLVARVLVALPTSWLNARFTFRSRVGAPRAYAAGLAGLVLGAVLAALTLDALHDADHAPSRAVELIALAVAQVLAAAVRFALLRRVALPAGAAPAPRSSLDLPDHRKGSHSALPTPKGANA